MSRRMRRIPQARGSSLFSAISANMDSFSVSTALAGSVGCRATSASSSSRAPVSSFNPCTEILRVLLPQVLLMLPPRFSAAAATCASFRVVVPFSMHSARSVEIPASAALSVRQPASTVSAAFIKGRRRSTRVTRRRPLGSVCTVGRFSSAACDSDASAGLLPKGSTLTSHRRSGSR